MHAWVYERAHDEFFATFGVRAPGDPYYDPAKTAYRWGRPPITQALDLYAAVRRFGLDIPEPAIRRLKVHAESAEREAQWREMILAEPHVDWVFQIGDAAQTV